MLEVLILGGGAAGLMCALRLGELGIRTIVLEKNREVGTKDFDLRGTMQLYEP